MGVGVGGLWSGRRWLWAHLGVRAGVAVGTLEDCVGPLTARGGATALGVREGARSGGSEGEMEEPPKRIRRARQQRAQREISEGPGASRIQSQSNRFEGLGSLPGCTRRRAAEHSASAPMRAEPTHVRGRHTDTDTDMEKRGLVRLRGFEPGRSASG